MNYAKIKEELKAFILKELEYAQKALGIVPKVNNNRWEYDAYYKMALAYSRLGLIDSSLYYLDKVEPLLKYVPQNGEYIVTIEGENNYFWLK
jgi:hypothetical protein